MYSDGEMLAEKKLQELILYIASACQADEAFGAVKLNKILFYADFYSYMKRGVAITGQPYQRLKQGPAPRRLVPARDALVGAGRLALLEKQHYNRKRSVPIALADADLSVFSAEDIAIVDSVIRQQWGMSAADISEHSHQFLGWQLAGEGETIPYSVALVVRREPTAQDMGRAHALADAAKAALAL